MSDNRDPVERALEVLVYAPIGIGALVKDVAPSVVDMLVARGRAEVDRRGSEIRTRITTARSLGQVAVGFGVPLVRRRVQSRVDEMLGRSGRAATTTAPVPAPEPFAERAPAATIFAGAPAAGERAVNGDVPASSELPIPGYDALSASQVVERLSGLGREELDAVHAYENAHRQRRTILGKIEQLAG